VRAAVAVAGLVAVGAALLVPSSAPTPASDAAVPARIYAPFPLQRTANAAPAGPAVLLAGPFGGGDLPGRYESRNLVMGRDGSQRLVRTVNNWVLGKDVLLSPDGRYVAGNNDLEGSHLGYWNTAVLDLTTGKVRDYAGGVPVAWTPDGRRLLIEGDGLVRLLDLDTGEARYLFGVADELGGLIAFSPDGSRLAAQLGPELYLYDLAAGKGRKIAVTGPNRRLAGPGGWTPDGRIALVELVGCALACNASDIAMRIFRIVYLDAETGRVVGGPAFQPVRGVDIRLVGWQSDGDVVATVFNPAEQRYSGEPIGVPWPREGTWGAGNVDLLALHPGGGRTELVRLPNHAKEVDVALDLLKADRFGGPTPSIWARLADWLLPWTRRLVLIAAVAAAVIAVKLVRRRGEAALRWSR
jgi:hypothetical protein